MIVIQQGEIPDDIWGDLMSAKHDLLDINVEMDGFCDEIDLKLTYRMPKRTIVVYEKGREPQEEPREKPRESGSRRRDEEYWAKVTAKFLVQGGNIFEKFL